MREEGVVEGLTTAAFDLSVAAIGVLVGSSAYVSGLVATLLVVLILVIGRFRRSGDSSAIDKKEL